VLRASQARNLENRHGEAVPVQLEMEKAFPH